jgi:hypothetical protein
MQKSKTRTSVDDFQVHHSLADLVFSKNKISRVGGQKTEAVNHQRV